MWPETEVVVWFEVTWAPSGDGPLLPLGKLQARPRETVSELRARAVAEPPSMRKIRIALRKKHVVEDPLIVVVHRDDFQVRGLYVRDLSCGT